MRLFRRLKECVENCVSRFKKIVLNMERALVRHLNALTNDMPTEDVNECIKSYMKTYMNNVSYLYSEILKMNIGEISKRIEEQNKDIMYAQKEVHVVFITDNNYAFPTAIAISSLFYSAKKETKYIVHILGIDLEEDMKEFLLESGRNVEIISLPESLICGTFEHEHVSKAALFKFKIAEILPQLSRVIYLDSDMLILGDLQELYEVELEKEYAAVVPDYHIMNSNYRKRVVEKRIGIDNYFNSGMLVLNLDSIRKDKMGEHLLSIKRKISQEPIFSFMDQDAFNIGFARKVKFVSVKYNFLNCYYEEIDKFLMHQYENVSFDEMCGIYEMPSILHIGGKNKPWKTVWGEQRLLYEKYIKINDIYRGAKKC